ncbi:uncharacterized protein I206_107202 [Kwoniella pini CBS 10737]|uniref:ACB domain-containing protein n=1 Tax=Kwoniella pini CBS 10737 TaxID=1296096 RepID=A0A1B9HZ00_9TREE|nr:uncharacterized protein I206_05253 [Kwoniella pini CBS 10737]OCF48474.1 hypothetical protein I206_05253 [Kwoniella pini CBS 10737]
MSDKADQTQKEFVAASTWLSSAPSAASLSTDLKLELYGLFKFLNTHAGPEGNRPSIFSPAPRAKYDAWALQFAKYSPNQKAGQEMARQRYLEIARQVGWAGIVEEEEEDDIDLENLDDEPSNAGNRDKSQGRADNPIGGVKVSIMSGQEETEDDIESASPLHDAVSDDNRQIVQALIKRDPRTINLKDPFGYTPLHLAADRGHVEMVKLLLRHGADREAIDEDNQTPQLLAEISGRDEIVEILKQA